MIFIACVTAAHGALDALTSIGAATSPVQFFSPFSSRGYTASSHPIRGPFGELFLCVLPLSLVTWMAWRARGLPWPARAADPPLTIGRAAPGDVRPVPNAAVVRRWICVGLLALLAFWGWRSEQRRADTRSAESHLPR
jgi:hypothetical protein